MNEKQIQNVLVWNRRSPFWIRKRFAVIPNSTPTRKSTYEADLLAITDAWHLYECEIKLSLSDFKADFKKKKWNRELPCTLFYYAMPEELAKKAISIKRPDRTGLISIIKGPYGRYKVKILEKAVRRNAKKLSPSDVIYLLAKMGHRYWSKR